MFKQIAYQDLLKLKKEKTLTSMIFDLHNLRWITKINKKKKVKKTNINPTLKTTLVRLLKQVTRDALYVQCVKRRCRHDRQLHNLLVK